MDSQEGKDNKKISHLSFTKLIPRCLTKFLLLGNSGLEVWKRTSTPSDSPNKLLFYILSVISTFICFLWDVPWTHPLSVHFGHILSSQLKTCSRTQPSWFGYPSVSKRQLVRKQALLAEESIML